MNPSEIFKYITEKGYTHSKIYNVKDNYEILVMKDWPKNEREPRRWFSAPSVTELFYVIQSEL